MFMSLDIFFIVSVVHNSNNWYQSAWFRFWLQMERVCIGMMEREWRRASLDEDAGYCAKFV